MLFIRLGCYRCNNNTKQNKMVKFACPLLTILSALFTRSDWFFSFHLSKICFNFSILSRDSFVFISFLAILIFLCPELCFNRTFKLFGILNRILYFGIMSNTALFSLLFLSAKDGWKRKITRDRLAIADTEGIVTTMLRWQCDYPLHTTYYNFLLSLYYKHKNIQWDAVIKITREMR